MFLEYPKALYRGDEMRIANDAAQEAALRAEGFADWGAPAVNAAPPAPVDLSPGAGVQDGAAPTLESVRAQLDAAGIKYDRRVKDLAKLQALLTA